VSPPGVYHPGRSAPFQPSLTPVTPLYVCNVDCRYVQTSMLPDVSWYFYVFTAKKSTGMVRYCSIAELAPLLDEDEDKDIYLSSGNWDDMAPTWWGPCGAGAPLFPRCPFTSSSFPPFYFSLSFIGFTYFLLLSIPSLSTRIVPLHF